MVYKYSGSTLHMQVGRYISGISFVQPSVTKRSTTNLAQGGLSTNKQYFDERLGLNANIHLVVQFVVLQCCPLDFVASSRGRTAHLIKKICLICGRSILLTSANIAVVAEDPEPRRCGLKTRLTSASDVDRSMVHCKRILKV